MKGEREKRKNGKKEKGKRKNGKKIRGIRYKGRLNMEKCARDTPLEENGKGRKIYEIKNIK